MVAIQELIDLLEGALKDRAQRLEHVKNFQARVWASKDLHPDPQVAGLIRDLAYDLDFFEPDERARAEDPVYFGDARLEEEIRSALRKLRPLLG